MAGENQPPFRMPCEGVAGKPLYFGGARWQHGIGNQKVDKYTNTTTVPNPLGGADIAPYERFTPDESGPGSCEVHFCAGDAVPCSEWPEPVPTNVFTHIDGDLVDFAVGHKRGWKAVQAACSWHGVLPWTAPEAGCTTVLCSDGLSGYQEYQSTASQLKYLTATYSADYEVDWGDIEFLTRKTVSATASGARTVNALSGEISSSLTTSEDDYDIAMDGTSTQTFHAEGGAGWSLGHDEDGNPITATFEKGMTTVIDLAMQNDLHCAGAAVPAPYLTPSDTPSDVFALISAWNTLHGDTPFPAPTNPNSYDETATAVNPTFGGGTITQTITYRISWSRTATVYSWAVSFVAAYTGGITIDQRATYSGSVTLSDANSGDDVLADCYVLLDLWNLANDKEYPWRTDLKGSLAPYVTRKEQDNTSPLGFNPVKVDDLTSPITDANDVAPFDEGWIPTYDLRDWFDDRIYKWLFPDGMDATNSAATSLYKVFDGSILGAPLAAGYQNNFDFLFKDIRGCCQEPGDGSKNWAWYQVGWGMSVDAWNTLCGTQIPRNATQVNNWFQAANKPAGAFIVYADGADYFPGDCISSTADAHARAGDALKIVACKYAEILEQWPSQNFGEPSGDMKFWYDETRVVCATGEDAVWSLIDPKTGLPPGTVEADDYWGGPVVGGFYQISSWDGAGTVTLGAKKFDVPSNWASKSNGDSATCFGPLRWSDKPSLLGRIAITTTGPGTTLTFASSQPAFGMDASTHQEQVDLYDASMTALATNVAATRVDDTHFTIASGQPTAVWVQIHGAAKWYMNDATPKGDVTVLQWWFDYRNLGEQGRLNVVTDCDGDPVSGPDTITYSNADCNSNDSTVAFPGNGFARFCQTQRCVPFQPCAPRVVCISPSAESFPNGVTLPMPTTLNWDEQYGTRYQAVVDSTMVDLFWQTPHFPCNIESCSRWIMDDGTCHDDTPLNCPEFCCPGDDEYDGSGQPPIYYYSMAPLVEARLTVPGNYGAAQNEAAPDLPDGIQIGWLSPVDHNVGVAGVALPPVAPGPLRDNGIPGNCNFTWALHANLCAVAAGGCHFAYNYPGCIPSF